MLKANKKMLILTSLVTLLPIPLCLLLRYCNLVPRLSRIPAAMVCMLSLLFLAGEWLAAFVTGLDPRNDGRNNKPFSRILWIFPILSIFSFLMTCEVNLGMETFRFQTLECVVFGFLFTFIGNLFPKLRPNSTMGLRLSWTLGDAENWTASHRFAGKLWFVGGILILLSALLPGNLPLYFFFAILLLLVLLPIGYSYRFYRRKLAAGAAPESLRPKLSGSEKKWNTAVLGIVAVVAVLVLVLLFTGSIRYGLEDQALTVQATFYSGLELPYDAIESIEYRLGPVSGARTWGVGSARLQVGLFQSNELGFYTRYTYTGSESSILIRTATDTLVLADKDTASTQALYNAIQAHLQ